MRGLSLAFAALCAAALSACSGGDARPTLNLEIIETLRSSADARLNPPAPRPPVTRAVLDTLDGAFMEAVIEKDDQLAYLFVTASGRTPDGAVQIVWRSEDAVNLVLRNDVLLAARGIRGDLISSDVQISPSRIGPQPGERRMFLAALDNQSVQLVFACEVTDLGPATISIVERSHRTRHYQERCEGPAGSITNDYWIDSGAGIAWQSRQWAGPEVGYIRFRRLTSG